MTIHFQTAYRPFQTVHRSFQSVHRSFQIHLPFIQMNGLGAKQTEQLIDWNGSWSKKADQAYTKYIEYE